MPSNSFEQPGVFEQRSGWDARLAAFERAPRDTILSDPFPVPGPLRGRMRCCALEPPAGALEADEGSGWDRLAQIALGPVEKSEWLGKGGPKRRREWLLGRVAAKDAVRLHLAAVRGLSVPPAEIAIDSDDRGRPFASGALLGRLGLPLAISLSHTDGIAMAVSTGEADGVGVDVERVGRRRGDYAEAAFTPGEIVLLDAAGPERRAERALRLWCAKEAVAKALGSGLMGNPMNLEAHKTDPGLTRIDLVVAGSLARALPDRVGRPTTAYVEVTGGYVVAAALDLHQPMP